MIELLDEVQFIMFLVRKELNLRRLARSLQKIGVVEVHLEAHLDSAILQKLNWIYLMSPLSDTIKF